MTIEIFDFPQNSDEWLRARLGRPTSSMFAAILAKSVDRKGPGKTRATYMRRLASEIITGEPFENYTNSAMERGHAMEDEVRQRYAFIHDVEPQRVGFIRNGVTGCSPDALINNDGILEIKTKQPDLLIECIERNTFPSEHHAQCQGALWITGREWIDIACYWPKLPMFVKRARRDDGYIDNLASEVARFSDELQAMVERVRRYGK